VYISNRGISAVTEVVTVDVVEKGPGNDDD
jgi:hypothetical protein